MLTTQITGMKWLETPDSPSQHGRNISLSDLRKRTEILHEFVYYIFDSLLIPLVRSNFYVTETQIHRNRLFYFRYDVWRRLIEKPMADMKLSMFDEIKRDEARRILARKSLTYSAVRLLPKAAGTRPIINLRRRTTKQSEKKTSVLGPSINSMVTPVLNMLNYEKTQNRALLGSSLFSVGDMYPRLRAFKDRLTQAQGASEKPKQLYFVKLDIQSCFDTIPQGKLIALVESFVSDPVYHITKHVEIRPAEHYRSSVGLGPLPPQGKPMRKFVNKASGIRDIFNTSAFGGHTAEARRNTVYVDTATAKNHRADTLLDLLDEHVRNNLVKIGKKYFRQRNGIPQGSVLSSLLCSFFYGELERKVLGFLDSEECLLLRLIDDFLLITAAPDLARQFAQVMMDRQPAYGISINPSKSLVNFEMTVNGVKMPRLLGSTLFPYCGNLIDTHTLDLRKDRDHGRAHVADTLTVESNRVPGRAFHRKVLASFRIQTHAMFLDTHYNRPKVVLLGIYTNFVETAIKMYRYYKALRPRCRPSPRLVQGIIRDLIQFANNLVQSKRRVTRPQPQPLSTAAKEPPGEQRRVRCSVPSAHIHHLGAAAFHHVLARKQTQFPSVLHFLLQMQKSHRPTTDRELLQMRTVIREGNQVFDHWRY
jgi:telomerase reverse transcriptase